MELIIHRVMPAMVRNIPTTASADRCVGKDIKIVKIVKIVQNTTSTVFFKYRRSCTASIIYKAKMTCLAHVFIN